MMIEKIKTLIRGTSSVIPQEDFVKKLTTGKKLRIKFGIDPTSPDLHLGHAVVLSKLKEFQDLGHEIIFLIGDFTARIGDPTGRSKTRPPLTDEQITSHFKTYLEQVGVILDITKITVRYNSEWLDKLTSKEWIQLCAKVTASRILEREDFANRLSAHQPIGFHELLYPIIQGYDSVALQADIEMGGTDQTFNLLMGRELQEHFEQEPQVVVTMPLLPGLDGTMKMSKSLNNQIGLTEAPESAYGKLMSISDDLMWIYYDILLKRSSEEITALQNQCAQGTAHPMTLKKAMAHAIVAKFWGGDQADAAQKSFEHLFQQHDLQYAQPVERVTITAEPTITIIELLKKLNAVESSSEARRLIQAGAVSINGAKVIDLQASVSMEPETQIKVGKHRFYKLV